MDLKRILATSLFGLAASQSHALPLLQLDIAGGSYVNGSEQSTFSAGDIFTLYAYLTPGSKYPAATALDDTYYVVAALTPAYGPNGGSLGSFTFNGKHINVTSGMFYGVPPVDQMVNEMYPADKGDLAPHGIYPTYFAEFSFKFSAAQQAALMNVQDITGTHTGPTAGAGMYYVPFTVDMSGLNPNYSLHFDLYSASIKAGGDVDVNKFAPFSHDAEGSRSFVPEPGALSLAAMALLALLGLSGTRKRRSA